MTLGRLVMIASLPTLALAWVVLQYIQPDGARTVTWQAGQASPFINAPLPAERVEVIGDDLKLTGDPIYFHITPPPGHWQTMRVAVDLEPGDQSVIELGVVTDPRLNALDLRPIYHAVLDKLGPEWDRTLQSGVLTATRRGSELTRATTRVYRATGQALPPQSWSLGRVRTLPVNLQGGHEFWFYAQAGQDFTWSSTVVDQNKVSGPDELTLSLFGVDGQELTQVALPDASDNNPRAINLTQTLPAAGAYRLVMSSTSDITWTTLSTNASKLVSKNQIRFAQDSAAPIWTTAAIVGVNDRLGQQAQGLGEGEHQLSNLLPGSSLVGEGWFALRSSDVWQPTLTPLTSATDLGVVNQIIATEPASTQDFSLANIVKESSGSFRLVLSLPSVSALPATGQPVLKSLKLTFLK